MEDLKKRILNTDSHCVELMRIKNYQEAIQEYNNILKEFNKNDFAEFYIKFKVNISTCKFEIYEKTMNENDLIESTKILEEVLKFEPINNYSFYKYCMVYYNLANQYQREADIRNRLQNLKLSITNIDALLANIDKKHYEVLYFQGKLILGSAQMDLSDYEDTKENLRKAEDNLTECKVFFSKNPERDGENYFITISNLSSLYTKYYDFNNEISWLYKSKSALKYLDENVNIETLPDFHAQNKYFLGFNITKLALINKNYDSLNFAIKNFDESLNILKPDKFGFYYYRTIMGRAEAMGHLGINTLPDGESLVKDAVDSLKNCLNFFTLQEYPLFYALTNKILGDIYFLYTIDGSLEKARNYFQESLKIFSPSNFGKAYMVINKKLEAINKKLNSKP